MSGQHGGRAAPAARGGSAAPGALEAEDDAEGAQLCCVPRPRRSTPPRARPSRGTSGPPSVKLEYRSRVAAATPLGQEPGASHGHSELCEVPDIPVLTSTALPGKVGGGAGVVNHFASVMNKNKPMAVLLMMLDHRRPVTYTCKEAATFFSVKLLPELAGPALVLGPTGPAGPVVIDRNIPWCKKSRHVRQRMKKRGLTCPCCARAPPTPASSNVVSKAAPPPVPEVSCQPLQETDESQECQSEVGAAAACSSTDWVGSPASVAVVKARPAPLFRTREMVPARWRALVNDSEESEGEDVEAEDDELDGGPSAVDDIQSEDLECDGAPPASSEQSMPPFPPFVTGETNLSQFRKSVTQVMLIRLQMHLRDAGIKATVPIMPDFVRLFECCNDLGLIDDYP